MSFSDFLERSLLNKAFGATDFTPSGTLYVALSSGNPLDTGLGGTEVTGGNYSRASISNDKTNWSTATGTAGQLTNMTTITFPAATANWGYVDFFAVYDQPTNGNIYGAGTLNTPRTILSGDQPVYSSGNLVITLD